MTNERWFVSETLLEVGRAFYQEVQETRASAGRLAQHPRRARRGGIQAH